MSGIAYIRDRLRRWLPARARQGPDGVSLRLEELIGLRDQALALALSQHRRSAAAMPGDGASPFYGQGMDLEELRAYQPGDDIRHIDWSATARTGRPHTKRFREERERPVFVIVDYRSAMFFASRQAFKSVVAARAAALTAWGAHALGDRVGALVFGDRHHRVVPPTSGRRGAVQVLQALVGLHDDAGQGPPLAPEPLVAALKRAHASAPRGSLLHLISDLAGLNGAVAAQIARLARSHDLVTTLVYDDLELEPPPAGRYAITDGGEAAIIDAGDERYRGFHRRRFQSHDRRVVALLRRHRCHLLRLNTRHAVEASLRLVLQQRAARGVARP